MSKKADVMQVEQATAKQANDLLSYLTPALAEGKLDEALELLRQHWTVPQLAGLLGNSRADIRKVAALALGLVGDKRAVGPLAVALHDADAMVTQMAEHSLWGIWFRLGKGSAVALLKSGSCHLNHGNYDVAVEKCSRAIEEDPEFAEAYNQRAIAHYLAERYEAAIADCKATMARMPQHFGAMSGMGHSYAHLGKWGEAKHCYRLALAMHPRLEGIKTGMRQIEEIMKK